MFRLSHDKGIRPFKANKRECAQNRQIQREVKERAMPQKRRKGQCPQTPSKTVAIANNGRHYRENRRVKFYLKGKKLKTRFQLVKAGAQLSIMVQSVLLIVQQFLNYLEAF